MPIVGVFAPRVAVVNPHVALVNWSVPAFDVVGGWITLIKTPVVKIGFGLAQVSDEVNFNLTK